MAEASVKRRGHGEDAIYFEAAKNRYVGAVSLGHGPDGKRVRRKVSGRTKQEVRDKLKALHAELDAGIWSSAGYTVRRAVEDWLREGLDGRSERTRGLYEGLLEPVLEIIGGRPLRSLSAGDVRSALGQLTSRYSTRSLQITRTSLDRAIRHAQANDLVGRDVAALVQPPHGRTGRPSKSFSLEQAKALLAAAEGTRMHAYVALSLLVGIRTEEARALRWDHVIRWVDDSGGWQPVTSAGVIGARHAPAADEVGDDHGGGRLVAGQHPARQPGDLPAPPGCHGGMRSRRAGHARVGDRDAGHCLHRPVRSGRRHGTARRPRSAPARTPGCCSPAGQCRSPRRRGGGRWPARPGWLECRASPPP